MKLLYYLFTNKSLNNICPLINIRECLESLQTVSSSYPHVFMQHLKNVCLAYFSVLIHICATQTVNWPINSVSKGSFVQKRACQSFFQLTSHRQKQKKILGFGEEALIKAHNLANLFPLRIFKLITKSTGCLTNYLENRLANCFFIPSAE